MKVNTFIVGVAKCGTSSLAHWLGQHNEVCMSEPKEPRYFNFNIEKGLNYYESFFLNYLNQKIIVDASPTYSYLPFVAERIYQYNPDAKIIFCIRNPIARAYSFWKWWSNMRPGREILSFEDAIEKNLECINYNLFKSEYEYITQCDSKGGPYRGNYIESSMYMRQIRYYNSLFGEDNIHTVCFESLISDPYISLSRVCRFLKINSDEELMNINAEPINVSEDKRNVFELHPEICILLKEIFYGDVVALSKYTGYNYVNFWL